METVIEQQKKQRSRVCKEVYFHIFGVILLIGLTFTIAVYGLKRKEKRVEKIVVTLLGLLYFIFPASIILDLKAVALKNLDPQKLRNWIVWEIFNMTILTLFIGVGTTFMLPPPFDFTTGTILLMIIYWLPLFAYKTAQLFRIQKFIQLIELSLEPVFVV